MYIVKVTYNYDWPLFRQTPNSEGIWGNYKFVIDDNLNECDFWIIYSDYKLDTETVYCNKKNIIFVPAECFNTSSKFSKHFLEQFGSIFTVQRELKHKNIIYSHNANPWFINKSYDGLMKNKSPEKKKLISVITSNKVFTPGHAKRLEFVEKLKKHYGDKIDIFGRGIKDFNDKWDVVAPYKFSIAIENDFCEDWVTEKFFDCLYSNTFTFYYGCPNLEAFIDKNCFQRIDIDDFDKSVSIIDRIINDDNFYEAKKDILSDAKIKSLNQDQFFPLFVSLFDNMNPKLPKEKQIIKSMNYFFNMMKLIMLGKRFINKFKCKIKLF